LIITATRKPFRIDGVQAVGALQHLLKKSPLVSAELRNLEGIENLLQADAVGFGLMRFRPGRPELFGSTGTAAASRRIVVEVDALDQRWRRPKKALVTSIPHAPPAIFSNASKKVPCRSGVSVCIISKAMALPKMIKQAVKTRLG
jgi:hypothetical protein